MCHVLQWVPVGYGRVTLLGLTFVRGPNAPFLSCPLTQLASVRQDLADATSTVHGFQSGMRC